MATTHEETTRKIGKDIPPGSDASKIDRNAPAGSENSLGAENVRVACPAADDGTVETIDEEVPASPLRSPPTSPEAVASCSSKERLRRGLIPR